MKVLKRVTSLFFAQRMTLSQLLSFVLIILPAMVYSRPLVKEHEALQAYIKHGLQENLAIAQENSQLAERRALIKKMSAYKTPQIVLHGRYTLATGGRTMDLPVGDMLNPVYEELGFSQRLSNVELPLLPNRDQETKIRVAQPLLNRKIWIAEDLHSSLAIQQEKKVKVTEVEIAAAIRKSYYSWIKIQNAIQIAKESINESTEHLRVAQKLVSQGLSTSDIVYGAEAQLFQAEQVLLTYINQANSIKALFNQLLNRNITDSLISIFANDLLDYTTIDTTNLHMKDHALLSLFQQGKKSASLQTALEKTAYIPTISAFVDLGITGDRYSFEEEYRFAMGGLSLEWEILHGAKKRAGIEASKAVEERISHEEMSALIEIERTINDSRNAVASYEKALIVARKQHDAAKEQYRLVTKKFNSGLATFTELIDAKSRFNQASLNIAIVETDLLSAKANLIKSFGITGI